jgi:hypothetical protein
MLEKQVRIHPPAKKLVGLMTLENHTGLTGVLAMADHCMIILWIVNFGARFGEKQGPIPLYKRH